MVDFPALLVMNIDCLTPELLNELKEISINSEEEICGFLIKSNDDYFFKRCKNIHPDPKNYFLISPKEYNFDDGTIVFHSHPKNPDDKGFSDWDLENQFYFCLPMLLYSVINNEFHYKTV